VSVLIKTPNISTEPGYTILTMPTGEGAVIAKGGTLIQYKKTSDGGTITTLAPFDLKVDRILAKTDETLAAGQGVLEVTKLVAEASQTTPHAPKTSKVKALAFVFLLLLIAGGYFAYTQFEAAQTKPVNPVGVGSIVQAANDKPYYVPIAGQQPK